MYQKNTKENIESLIHLDKHIYKLKKRILKYISSISSDKKIYLNPSEDLKIKYLLISYWKTRAALIDIIVQSKINIKQKNICQNNKIILFLISYASTLLLLDITEFLVKHSKKSKILINKFNEEINDFEIPAYSYDQIKKSLNTTKNLWYIYKAKKTYEQNEKIINKLKEEDKNITILLKIIKESYSYKNSSKLKKSKNLLNEIKYQIIQYFKRPIKKQIFELQELAGNITSNIKIKPWYKHQIPKKIKIKMFKLLKAGDIVVTRRNYRMTNYFLPGYWGHVLLYIGDINFMETHGINKHKNIKKDWKKIKNLDKNQHRIIEALKDGVKLKPLNNINADALAIIRPKLKEKDIIKAIMRACLHINKPYDFDFNIKSSNKIVCTELIYRSYEGLNNIHFPFKIYTGKLNISSESILYMAMDRKFFEPIAVYSPKLSKKIYLGKDVDYALNKTMKEKYIKN